MKQFIKYISYIIILSLTIFDVYAQGKSSVSGIVIDEIKAPMPQLSVRVLNSKDSSFVKGSTSSDKGKFKISELSEGSYIFHFSYLGYNDLYKNVSVKSGKESINLGTIEMKPADIMLSEAVIVGKTPDIIAKEDTLEYNADSYKTQPNAVVEDMIKKMPGIEIDENGKITANGKEVKKILIDGQEFFSDDPKVASKNLPANMVDKLQVIDRKSDEARFSGVDDGEDETIINLTVKKGMKNGWFGNIQAGGATGARYEGMLMANYFKDTNQLTILAGANNTNNMGAADLGGTMFSGSSRRGRGDRGPMQGENSSAVAGLNFNVGKTDKFRAGGDVKYAYSDLDLKEHSERQNFLSPDSSTFDNSLKENRNKSHNIEMNYRLLWNPDEYTQIEFRPNFKFNSSKMSNNSASSSFGINDLGQEERITTGSLNSHSKANGYNVSGRLSVSRKLKGKEGRQISLSLNYGYNNSKEDGYSYNNTSFYKSGVIENTDLKDNNHSWGGSYDIRASYVEPINKHTTWSVSYNYRYNYTYADKLSYNINSDGSLGDLNTEYSNSFRNNFQRHKASTSFNGTYDKMNYNVGLDFEPSKSESRNLIDSSRDVDGKMQFNLSPFLRYNYSISQNEYLRISYRGRTQQPSISQLQPSQTISDPLRRTEGNPDLKASYDNSLNIRYNSFNRERQRSMMLMLNANYVMNSIVNATFYDKEGIQITKPVNENGVWNIWSMFLTNMPFKNKKFSFNNFTSFGCNRQIGYSNSLRNASMNYNIKENLEFVYSDSFGDIRIGGNGGYQRTKNSIQSSRNENTFDYGAKFATTIYIPSNITFTTDVNFNGKAGYSDGYDKKVWLWNAQLSWNFLKQKQASLIVRAYDILNQNKNISRSVTGNYIQDIETNSVGRYVMFSFAYRFNSFAKKGESTPQIEMNNRRGPHGGGRW
ncbi:MAG: TonB-dependent receptor family protein [Bacteroidales bacterium]|nr:TonB-dependent receptor family protein [Bacteroidales bacterium]